MAMTLEIQGKRQILDPSLHEIETAVKSMTLTDDCFLILSRGEDGFTYIQAMLEDNSLWTVEYQDGSLEKHFQASNVDTKRVVTMFLAFAGGDETWRDAAQWTRTEL